MEQQKVASAPVSHPLVTPTSKPTKAKAKEKPKAKVAVVKANAGKVKGFVDKFRAGTIGRMTVELIVSGKKSNDEILAEVKRAHKGSETTSACIAWYRSKARKEGIIS